MADSSSKDSNTLGITFQDVRSDERHQSINGRLAEAPLLKKKGGAHESMFDVERALDAETSNAGTIISDKKRIAPPLKEGLASVFKEWWTDTKTTLENVDKEGESEPVATEMATPRTQNASRIKTSIPRFTTFKRDVAKLSGRDDAKVPEDSSERKEGADASKIVPVPRKQPAPPLPLTEQLTKEVLQTKLQSLPASTLASLKDITVPVDRITIQPKVGERMPSKKVRDNFVSQNIPTQPSAPSLQETLATTVDAQTAEALLTEKLSVPAQENRTQTPSNTPKSEAPQRVTEQSMKRPYVAPTIAHTNEALPKVDTERKEMVPAVPTASTKIAAPIFAAQVTERTNPVTPKDVSETQPIPPQATINKPMIHEDIPAAPDAISTKTTMISSKQQSVSHENVRMIPTTAPEIQVTEPVKQPNRALEMSTQPVATLPVVNDAPIEKMPFHATEAAVGSSTRRKDASPMSEENTSRMFSSVIRIGGRIALGLVSIVIVLYGGYLLYTALPESTSETNPGDMQERPRETFVDIPHRIPVDTYHALPLFDATTSYTQHMSYALGLQDVEMTQYYATITLGTTTRLATPQEIVSVMNIRMPDSFRRSLQEPLMFGGIQLESVEPFLIITAKNFDVLFAGMLAWEQFMLTDLQPLFGTATPAIQKFQDGIIANKAIRSIKGETGQTLLVYGYIDSTTILITHSVSAFEALVKKF
jgi:hypothetical protein